MRIHKYTLPVLALLVSGLFSCKTGKNTLPAATYTFRVQVREKYCHAARLDATLVKESEREKAYASQVLFLIKNGSTDTLSVTTGATGEWSATLPAGSYGIYFPEKITGKRANNTQRCRDWQATPDTVIRLTPSETSIPLKLFRGCSPCQPIRQ